MSEKFELISSDKKTQIKNQIQGTEVQFSHGYQRVSHPLDSKKAYKEFVVNLASHISNVVELRMNKSFHDSLNTFEQWGLVAPGTQEAHKRGVKIKKEVIVAGTLASLHALPHLYAWHQERQKKNEFLTTLVSWSGWIVEEENFVYESKIKKILEQNNIYNERKVRSVFNDYAGGELQSLPLFAPDNPEEFFKLLVQLSDTENPEQGERARALGKECLGLRGSQIEEYIRAGRDSQLTTSDLVSFNSNFIKDYAQDLFDSLPQAAQFTNYMEINDPYRFGREARLQQLKSTGSKLAVGGVLGAITLTTGGVGDVIAAASGPLLFNLIGDSESKKQLEFAEAYQGMLRDLKIKRID